MDVRDIHRVSCIHFLSKIFFYDKIELRLSSFNVTISNPGVCAADTYNFLFTQKSQMG